MKYLFFILKQSIILANHLRKSVICFYFFLNLFFIYPHDLPVTRSDESRPDSIKPWKAFCSCCSRKDDQTKAKDPQQPDASRRIGHDQDAHKSAPPPGSLFQLFAMQTYQGKVSECYCSSQSSAHNWAGTKKRAEVLSNGSLMYLTSSQEPTELFSNEPLRVHAISEGPRNSTLVFRGMLNHVQCSFLVDSGSMVNAVSHTVARSIGLTIMNPTRMTLVATNGMNIVEHGIC